MFQLGGKRMGHENMNTIHLPAIEFSTGDFLFVWIFSKERSIILFPDIASL